jgi:hypothetical protein
VSSSQRQHAMLPPAASPAIAFEQLAEDMPRARHVQFELVPSDGTFFHGGFFRGGENLTRPRSWLACLLAPSSEEHVFPITVKGEVVGKTRLQSDSAYEIAEIVGEARWSRSVS